MANDSNWVADVRRWYLSGQAPPSSAALQNDDEAVEIGYEAAHPALQSRHWPDAPRGEFTEQG